MMADSQRVKQKPRLKSRSARIGLICMFAVFVLPGALGFINKFIEFYRTLKSDPDGGFTIVPMLTYLSVAAGFVCLLIWAILQGMFRDIERPKYTMLENEEKLDRLAQLEPQGD